MKHMIDNLRGIYSRIASSCDYENFIRTPNGARIERQVGGGGFSHLNFTNDRIQFTDDHVGITVDEFAEKVSTVLGDALPALRIPVILAQQVTVRLTVTPTSFPSAEDFLRQKLFSIESEDFADFGRPANLFGFRLMIPETKEERHTFNLRIESYMRDRRALYVENVGTYKVPIQPGGSGSTVSEHIEATSDFLQDRVIPFLARFDRRDSE